MSLASFIMHGGLQSVTRLGIFSVVATMKVGDRRDRGGAKVSGMSWLGLKNRRSENGCMVDLLIKIRWNPLSKLAISRKVPAELVA